MEEMALGALEGKDKDGDTDIDKDTPVQLVRKKRLWELSEVKL